MDTVQRRPVHISGQRATTSSARYHQVEAEYDDDDITSTRQDAGLPSYSSAQSEEKGSNSTQPEETDSKLQPPKKRLSTVRRIYDRVTADHWMYELMAVFVCVSTLVAIIAVLFAFRNKPLPHILGGVSLNTVISILATLSRAATVLVAAAVIAQQKWLRFEGKGRPLIEVLTYDDATRGPLGSLYLLLTLRLGYFTALAAVVAVLALGFEPFIQQSIRYPLSYYALSNASPPLLQAVQSLTTANFKNNNITSDFNALIQKALYADSIGLLQPKCPYAACDWPLYKSVAFCSTCHDALKNLTFEPQLDILQNHTIEWYSRTLRDTDMDLGNETGPSFSISKTTAYDVSLGQGATVAAFDLNTNFTYHVGDPYASMSLTYPTAVVWDITTNWDVALDQQIIDGVHQPQVKSFGYLTMSRSADGKRLVARSAKRCTISLCAQQYSSTFQNGSLTSHVSAMSWGVRPSNYENWSANLTGSHFNSSLNLDDLQTSISMLEGSVFNYTFGGSGFWPIGGSQLNYAGADTMQFMSDFEKICAKIALALTNYIQENPDSVVPGQGYMSTSVVEVRWEWLAYPIFLVAVVVVTLLATIIQTHRHKLPNWKSSPFPLIYNYYDPGARSTAPRGSEHEDASQESEFADKGTCFQPLATKTSVHQELANSATLRLRSVVGSWVLERESHVS